MPNTNDPPQQFAKGHDAFPADDLPELYRVALEHSESAHAIASPDGTLEWVSRSMCVLSGLNASRLLGMQFDHLLSDEVVEAALHTDGAPIATHFGTEEAASAPILVNVYPIRRDDGISRLSIWVREGGPDDEPSAEEESLLHFASAIAELQHSSVHDPLTNVMNRSAILGHLNDSGGLDAGAVFIVDVDNFRAINEGLSHEHGDEVLRAIAQRLSTVVGRDAQVGRIGADEFLVVVDSVENLDDVADLASRICHAVEQLHTDGKLPHVTTACIGAALHRKGATSDELIHEAQIALMRARSTGPARWKIFDKELRELTLREEAVGEELRIAVDSERISTWYQPIVDLTTGECVGWEALARWMLLDGTARPARDFIGFAEGNGAIEDLGRLVTRDAVRRAASTPDSMIIAVNIAPRQLDQSFVETLERLIGHYSTQSKRIAFELNYAGLASLDAGESEALSAALDLGIKLHVDNVGADLTLLNSLEIWPAAAVKLDVLTTTELRHGNTSDELRHSLAEMASALGAREVDTIAEGIEDPQQAELLRDCGWLYGQGYLFGAPAPLLSGRMPRPRDSYSR